MASTIRGPFYNKFTTTTCADCTRAIQRGETIYTARQRSTNEDLKAGNPPKRALAYHKACFEQMHHQQQQQQQQQETTATTTEIDGEEFKPVSNQTQTYDLVALIAGAVAPVVKAELDGALSAKLNIEEIAALVDAAVSKRLTTKIEVYDHKTKETRVVDGQHKSFTSLIEALVDGEHVYLHGPAGTGKSTAAQKAAEVLGLEFGMISLNLQTSDTRINGFVDANGVVRDTVFTRAYKSGGLFCIDEMDNASGNMLTALNSATANGHMACAEGVIQKHADFRLPSSS